MFHCNNSFTVHSCLTFLNSELPNYCLSPTLGVETITGCGGLGSSDCCLLFCLFSLFFVLGSSYNLLSLGFPDYWFLILLGHYISKRHKTGQSEEIQKKRTRRAVKFQRAITGASLADIMAKRNQKPEVRKAQREQAIRAAKEAKKAKQASKKTAMAAAKAPTKAAPKQKIVKPVKVSAPRVGGKR